MGVGDGVGTYTALQTRLLLLYMERLSKTEYPIFFFMCSLFPKATF